MKGLQNSQPLTSTELFLIMRLIQTGVDQKWIDQADLQEMYSKVNYQALKAYETETSAPVAGR